MGGHTWKVGAGISGCKEHGALGGLGWSYFVGQLEGKVKVDSDWVQEPSGIFVS